MLVKAGAQIFRWVSGKIVIEFAVELNPVVIVSICVAYHSNIKRGRLNFSIYLFLASSATKHIYSSIIFLAI